VTASESTNYAKFQTANPVVKRLIDHFYDRVLATISPSPSSLLDAGCGEGETLARFGDRLPPRVVAVDASAAAVAFTAERFPGAEVSRERLELLPYGDGEFELVLCLEVLEHLDRPQDAVLELARVSAGQVIVSVPFEPWFQLGSLARGKHLSALGNHPEHVNHYNRRSLRELLEPAMAEVSVQVSFPWLIARCRPRPAARPPATPSGSRSELSAEPRPGG
jgi:SAM-dependent methyltransferase